MSEVVQLGRVMLSMVAEVVEEPLSLLLHEITVRVNINMENMMSICFIWFPISFLGMLNI